MAENAKPRLQITRPVTLRITSAEVLESQLSPEDLSVLEAQEEAPAVCQGGWCAVSYSSTVLATEE